MKSMGPARDSCDLDPFNRCALSSFQFIATGSPADAVGGLIGRVESHVDANAATKGR